MNSTRVSHESLRRFIEAAFVKEGLPPAHSARIAELMAEADLLGADGHGVVRLPQYLKRLRAGGINKDPSIRVVRERSAMAIVDGDNGMGHLVVSRAVELAIKKARDGGVAWVGTRNSNHAGAASPYVRMPLEHGMAAIYFAVGNANLMPPWGGTEKLLSTNPIAVAIPTGDGSPIVLDMATTVAAHGKIKAKARLGQPMPEGWVIDREGKPLLDPTRASEGFLLPIGGYKGYALALVIGLLAGTLGGAAMGRDVIDFNNDLTSATNTGQAILVIDVSAFAELPIFTGAVETIARDIRESARLPGVDRIWLPGEQSNRRLLLYAEQGIPLAASLADELTDLARQLGIDPLPILASPCT